MYSSYTSFERGGPDAGRSSRLGRFDPAARPGPAPAGGLEASLVPIITRILQCGRGPAGLTAWLLGRPDGRALAARRGWDDEDRNLVRRLAREAVGALGRGHLAPAATYQLGETLRPEELGV